MKIFCTLFGHKPLTNSGWSGRPGYAKAWGGEVDGIGTKHLYLIAKCPRCGENYEICNVHVPK